MNNSYSSRQPLLGQLPGSLHFLAIGMALLLLFVSGCNRKASAPRNAAFQKLIQSHPLFSNPPAHSFRAVLIQKASPEFHVLTWGSVSGNSWSFRVSNLLNRPNIFPATTPVDYEALSNKMNEYIDVEQSDRINAGNGNYSFSVKKTDSSEDYLLTGLDETPYEVVTPSCVPFASMYDNCYLKNIEQHHEIEEVFPAKAEAFQGSTAVRMNHRTEDISKIVYIDEQRGCCIGERIFSPSTQLNSQIVYRYDNSGSELRLRASEVYFPDSNGKLELSRIHYFLSWSLDDSLDLKTCYLKHYGLPEPAKSSTRSSWLPTLGCIALVVLVLLSFTVVNRNRAHDE